MFSERTARPEPRAQDPLPRSRWNQSSGSNSNRPPSTSAAHQSSAAWSFSQLPLYAPGQDHRSQAIPWSSNSAGEIDGSRIDLASIGLHATTPGQAGGVTADGSLFDLSDDQDSLTPSVFERKPSGRGIHIRVNGGHPAATPEYPDGIRWIQTIDTNAPLFGQSPPYVDFIPPRDDKPFYFSDAMEAGQGGTFSDNPSRTANSIHWDASLSLVGVSGHVVTRIDSVNYGFDINASGSLSLHGPSRTGTADVVIQGDTLRSEYPDWVFSGGFAVPQVPAPGGPSSSGSQQA